MGTRNLTAVQLDGEYKVAQYGQWDGYPSGQGATVLEFLKGIKGKRKRKEFETKLRASSFATSEELDEVDAIIAAEQIYDSWPQRWPAYTRDTGAKILQLIMNSPPGIKLKNSIEFAADSLFCEFAYVIDLDKNVLEVYKGWNKKPLPKNARFVDAKEEGSPQGYYPIRKKASWPLDALPTQAEMEKKVGG